MNGAIGIVPTIRAGEGRISWNGRTRSRAGQRKTGSEPVRNTTEASLCFFVHSTAFMFASRMHPEPSIPAREHPSVFLIKINPAMRARLPLLREGSGAEERAACRSIFYHTRGRISQTLRMPRKRDRVSGTVNFIDAEDRLALCFSPFKSGTLPEIPGIRSDYLQKGGSGCFVTRWQRSASCCWASF